MKLIHTLRDCYTMATQLIAALHAQLKVLALILLLLIVYDIDNSSAQSRMVKIFDIQEMSSGGLSEDWGHVLPGKLRVYTNYTIDQGSEGSFLKLKSGGGGSYLEKELKNIDISETPVMEWAWKVERFPEVEWEEDTTQDDFAIRIELVYDYKGSRFNPLNIVRKGFFTTFLTGNPPEMVISYVWANNVPAERPYVSPSEKRMTIIPVESGASMQGRWIEERRNIKDDFDELINNKHVSLKKIRIRCDTDDSTTNAESGIMKLLLTHDNNQ